MRKRYRGKPVEEVKLSPFVRATMIVATSQRRVVIVRVTCNFILSSDFDSGMIPDRPSRIPVTEISKPVM